MKRRVFNEFNRRVRADAKRHYRFKVAGVKLLNAEDLYAKAYIDFVETRMVPHAFFFVYYRRMFNQYCLDIRDGIVL